MYFILVFLILGMYESYKRKHWVYAVGYTLSAAGCELIMLQEFSAPITILLYILVAVLLFFFLGLDPKG